MIQDTTYNWLREIHFRLIIIRKFGCLQKEGENAAISFENKMTNHCFKKIEFYEIPSRVAIQLVTLDQNL